MIYECVACSYTTKRIANLDTHKISKKHQQIMRLLAANERVVREKEQSLEQIKQQAIQQAEQTKQQLIQQNVCEYCKRYFMHSNTLLSHYEKCKNIKNLRIDYENKIKEIQNQSNIKINELQLKIDFKDKEIRTFEKTVEYLKSTLSGSGVILNKSVSTLQYVINTYKTSPPFKIMENIPSIENNGGDYDNDAPDNTDPITKNTKFVEILIYKYKNDSLIKYLGDFIIKHYKKGDPKQQSIWNSDTARMSYIIRHQIDENNAEWRSDKKGVLATKIAIDPLLKYVEESIVKYYASPNMQMNPQDASYESLYERIEGVTKMKQYIEEKIVSTNILKYIAPYFYLTKDDNLICIK